MAITKTQLAIFMDKHIVPHTPSLKGTDGAIRLATNKAWYKDFGSYIILRSYDTNVAIFVKRTGTLVVRDRYSTTTAQHVTSFISELEHMRDCAMMRVTYLYRRSDRVIERGWRGMDSMYKLTLRDYKQVKANDFMGYIPDPER